MAAFGATAVPAPPPAPAAAGWSPPPASAAQLPRGSPQPLKRPRPDDDDAQQQWQQQQQAAAQQLRAQRRRLDGGPDSPAPAFGLPPFPTPQPFQQQAQQQAQHQHAQQQAQQQPSQWPSSADLELEPASSMEAASSLEEEDGGAQGPAARRARTGAPEYRLVLPDALPPPIPASLLASAAQPWGAGAPPGLQPPAGDAWALVPWSPPLVAAQDLQRQQREQEESKVGDGWLGVGSVAASTGCLRPLARR